MRKKFFDASVTSRYSANTLIKKLENDYMKENSVIEKLSYSGHGIRRKENILQLFDDLKKYNLLNAPDQKIILENFSLQGIIKNLDKHVSGINVADSASKDEAVKKARNGINSTLIKFREHVALQKMIEEEKEMYRMQWE